MTVDEVYVLIAQNIKNSIQNENWNAAILYIQGDDNYVDTSGQYTDSNKNVQHLDVHHFDSDVDFAIMELHEMMENKWNKAVFTLASDGHFDMEFIWDQELADEIKKLANE